MEIQPIISKIAATSSEVFQAGKTGILWLGHTISSGFTLYVVPAAEKLANLGLAYFNSSKQLLRAQPGAIFALAGCLLLIGVTAFKIADRKAYEDDMFARTAWKIAGIVTFVGATALTSFGMYASLV